MEKSNRYLLDTNIFIWWMLKSERLDQSILDALEDSQNDIFISVISVWEIVIKKKSSKLSVPKDWKESMQESGYKILPMSLNHAFTVETIPLYHKDPFDRMLIAQAKVENLTLITSDAKIWKYDIPLLKA